MTYDKIKEFHERRPFQRFDIRTSDGRVCTVDHPEFLMQSRNRKVVTFTTEDNRDIVIDVSHVTSLEVTNSPAA